ncbi:sensor histidine kinase [Croceibacterium ferulae]|uniref:sensor histidine kinase n=1 Tax=Croceibacterium ferulae TaxID=1854641 RepID=UPI000EAC24FF|nr:sensor histidine kinase [Croceibacterium ferulae]
MNSLAALPQGARQQELNELLLRETNHRCGNDLQLVVSLLALQGRRAANNEVRQALNEAAERVAILARARRAMQRERAPNLETALRQVCEALHAQAEPRSIVISLQAFQEVEGLHATQITTLALVVNELATNAIKHAFEDGVEGYVHVSVDRHGSRDVVITVDDDGLPFPEAGGGSGGLGIDLVKRLMASIGGLFIPPPAGRKTFELRVPLAGS